MNSSIRGLTFFLFFFVPFSSFFSFFFLLISPRASPFSLNNLLSLGFHLLSPYTLSSTLYHLLPYTACQPRIRRKTTSIFSLQLATNQEEKKTTSATSKFTCNTMANFGCHHCCYLPNFQPCSAQTTARPLTILAFLSHFSAKSRTPHFSHFGRHASQF